MNNEVVEAFLVPVEVFGAEGGYGLMDAVQSWSDCNRAEGHIYRLDDTDQQYRVPGETLKVWANRKELDAFKERFFNGND